MTTTVGSRSNGPGSPPSTAASDQPPAAETETAARAATDLIVAACRDPRARPGRRLALSDVERATVLKWVRGKTTPQRVAFRGRILLLLLEGLAERAVARQLGTSRQTVGLWKHRVEREGIATILRDRPGRGRKPRHLALTDHRDGDTAA